MLVILSLLGDGQEEPGWRGFALARMLERWSPLEASVRLGVILGDMARAAVRAGLGLRQRGH